MDYQKKLFFTKQVYNHTQTEDIFLKAVKQNVIFHRKHCKNYEEILKNSNFSLSDLKTIQDLYLLPPIPTLFLKKHLLQSLENRELYFTSTSSGTSGEKSKIGFDRRSLFLGAFMIKRILSYHKLWSLHPVNYLILGYPLTKKNSRIASKTAFMATMLAPAKNRTYALSYERGEYQFDKIKIKKILYQYSKEKNPIRVIGFPSYLYFLLKELKQEGIQIPCSKDSMIFLGGGWKEFYGEEITKTKLYQLINQIFHIPKQNCVEFFGAAEHPMIYCSCKNHHFHIPSYSRVIVRDINTFLPVPNGHSGLLNFITPLLYSMPYVSIMTDDIGVLWDGENCGCGIKTPYFEVLGRARIKEIKTCSADAADLLKKRGERL